MRNIDIAINFLKERPGVRYVPEKLHEEGHIPGKYSAMERTLRRRVIQNELPLEPKIIGLRKVYIRADNGQKIAHYYWG